MSVIFADGVDQWRACRAEFELLLESAYAAAVDATNGNLLNKRGALAHVDPYSLFYGPRARAEAYASEELRAFWCAHPRVTFAEFEATWHHSPAHRDAS